MEYRKIMHNQPQYRMGFTLIELMVTIAIAGILLGVAIPSFISTIASNRLTANANELVTALNLARSEAVKRGASVTVRKVDSNSFTNLSSTANWENGWDVFTDADSDGNYETGDILIRTFGALNASYTLRGNTYIANFIRYQADGSINLAGNFVICNNDSITGAKLIITNAVGRVRIASDADHDGIPEKDATTEISSCTVTTGF